MTLKSESSNPQRLRMVTDEKAAQAQTAAQQATQAAELAKGELVQVKQATEDAKQELGNIQQELGNIQQETAQTQDRLECLRQGEVRDGSRYGEMIRDEIESREIDGEGYPIRVSLWHDIYDDGKVVWHVQLDGEIWAEIPGVVGEVRARAMWSAIADHITDYVHLTKLGPLVITCVPR